MRRKSRRHRRHHYLPNPTQSKTLLYAVGAVALVGIGGAIYYAMKASSTASAAQAASIAQQTQSATQIAAANQATQAANAAAAAAAAAAAKAAAMASYVGAASLQINQTAFTSQPDWGYDPNHAWSVVFHNAVEAAASAGASSADALTAATQAAVAYLQGAYKYSLATAQSTVDIWRKLAGYPAGAASAQAQSAVSQVSQFHV